MLQHKQQRVGQLTSPAIEDGSLCCHAAIHTREEKKKDANAPFRSSRIGRDDHDIRQIEVVANVLDGGRFRIELGEAVDFERE